MPSRDDLIAVLREARELLSRPGNDFSWSSWNDAADATGELDELMLAIGRGELPRLQLEVVFAPTGPMQEASLSSGWAQEFLDLAKRFDAALGA